MITKNDVKHVAALAKIYLKDEEAQHLTKDLENILAYIDKLETLDVKDVEPTCHVLPLKNVYREDKKRPSFEQNEALSFAVEKYKGSFKVPKIIE